MQKIKEHTYGLHIYMQLELDNGEQHEIDVYLRDDGTHYKTTGDSDETKRAEIIRAFNELY